MINPIALQLGPFSIYWYGLVYATGFLITLFFLKKQAKYLETTEKNIEDIAFYTMLFGVIGGRIFHIVFYEPSYYLAHLTEILRFDKGGMSIHGGLVFGTIAMYVRSKKFNVNILKFLDVVVIPLSLVLAFGRIANFINQELVGKVTSSFFGYVFPKVDSELRFPSQIFESLKNFFVFGLLMNFFYTKKLKPGMITAWFFILYNALRFLVDFTREPELELFLGLGMGQILSFIFFIIGLYLLKIIKK